MRKDQKKSLRIANIIESENLSLNEFVMKYGKRMRVYTPQGAHYHIKKALEYRKEQENVQTQSVR